MFVLKLKGIKKDFSKDPIDYKKIRKEDVHLPTDRFFKQEKVRSFTIDKTRITEVKGDVDSNKLIILMHGGAFICGPAKHHWDVIKTISQKTGNIVWMCDYPKAPEHQIQEISNNIDLIYQHALEIHRSENISLMGDSAGATLITCLTQRLVKNKLDLPKRIILVSPVMDSSMTNPNISPIDEIDPMLSTTGILSAKRMCAGNLALNNEMLSPLNGSFEGFPETTLFMAENDIMFPDEILAGDKMKSAQVDVELIIGNGMPHIWPFLPVMQEAKSALNKIIDILNS